MHGVKEGWSPQAPVQAAIFCLAYVRGIRHGEGAAYALQTKLREARVRCRIVLPEAKCRNLPRFRLQLISSATSWSCFDLAMKLRMPASVTGRSAGPAYAPSAEPVRIRARQSGGL